MQATFGYIGPVPNGDIYDKTCNISDFWSQSHCGDKEN